ncbi:MAG: hypothetical protein IPJ40_24270 [Saprospirales bacterium]|nr:hypothetical protein [Saprospirales bacterium]
MKKLIPFIEHPLVHVPIETVDEIVDRMHFHHKIFLNPIVRRLGEEEGGKGEENKKEEYVF